jgi:4-amino-4-deoxy-L-arabinose transferase-like glycosyltransferase
MNLRVELPNNAATVKLGPQPAGAVPHVRAALNRIAARAALGRVAAIGVIAALLFLVFYNLPRYPLTWFDEGSHLHVPKTLVTRGVYADYSSDGYRYYGPTIGVGPTVMLPIAVAFWVFGIGLLQARLVIALYLLATIVAFYRLARLFGNARLAGVATALLVTSQGIALLTYGRQVLGEVPGFFFLVLGLALWLDNWQHPSWRRLGIAGLMLGLSVVTKNQYLIVIVPALGLAWLSNLLYYRLAPQRAFVVPGLVAVACYGLWQLYSLLYLGPATALQNFVLLRNATAGAALVFSPALMKQALQFLLDFNVFFGLLIPVLAYGAIQGLPRRQEAQRWAILFFLVGVNLAWYVIASIGWPRYAFPGLALASLFVAKLFSDLTDGFHFDVAALWLALRRSDVSLPTRARSGIATAGLTMMIILPLARTAWVIVSPPPNAPAEMAAYLNQNVPISALIETWEPEMGFLTDHNYHFPPAALLNNAAAYIWLHGQPPSQLYDFMQPAPPEYVLVGPFGRWVNLYPSSQLSTRYKLSKSIDDYDLYQLQSSAP